MTSYETSGSSRTLTAFFRDREDADRAVTRLIDGGISNDSIRLVPGKSPDSAPVDSRAESTGFWDALGDFFFPDEDRGVYAEGLRRGGYLVSVSGIDQMQHDRALDILDDEGTIDVDDWADSWRAEGWTDSFASSSGMAEDRVSQTGTRGTGAMGASGATATGMGAAGTTMGSGASAVSDADRDVIPIVEEQLKVGKRDVDAGRVRVRSYVVETPVSETLSLRDENVSVERRHVDRPLTDADAAFKDRTIVAEAHREEAVVSKEARVREEVVVKKTASERTEKIDDTVRKTEIDIQDTRDKAVRDESLLGARENQRDGLNNPIRR